MKIFGLTLGQFGTALMIAGCIAFVYTFATMPHPVDVPKIAITPVPTPPPVVITPQVVEVDANAVPVEDVITMQALPENSVRNHIIVVIFMASAFLIFMVSQRIMVLVGMLWIPCMWYLNWIPFIVMTFLMIITCVGYAAVYLGSFHDGWSL